MKHVSLAEMQERLPELADAVEAGETVVVTRDGRPILDLVPHRVGKGLNFGAIDEFKMKHGIDRIFPSIPEDFDDPLPEDILLGGHPAWR